MGAVTSISLPIIDQQGSARGHLIIAVLPRSKGDILWDLTDDPDRAEALEPVQLQEGAEYRYNFAVPDTPTITTSHSEIFEPDNPQGTTGRLRPRLHTGTHRVTVEANQIEIGEVAFEVRSVKVDYLSHYRWMLEDIAAEFTGILMERFAPSEQRFTLSNEHDAATLYQRFVFLKHLLTGEQFDTAIQQILGRPHRAWVEEEEMRPAGRGLSPSSAVARQIGGAGTGPRIPWDGGPAESIPARLLVRRTEETLDTPENRFVKFALTQWRDVTADVERALASEPSSSPVTRGRREVRAVLEQLDALLSADLFAEVGRMTHLPAASQVLQKRAGYRDLFRAYVQFEAAWAIHWEGGDEVYSAGQRNVAALYEYWVFLRLRLAVASLCEEGLEEESLFERQPDGLGVQLKRGRQLLLKGTVTRNGRKLRLDLYFNRGFQGGHGSWSLTMRPDCSLQIRPHESEPAPFEPIWLHFDAKYRIEELASLFDPEDDPTGTVKNADLLKMHAYRDAIRRSAGSYVIYPGTDARREPFRMYHEILPGLGAFALRPTGRGETDGLDGLRRFLDDVVNHVSTQTTQHERGRFWLSKTYAGPSPGDEPVQAAPFLKQPPADTRVLLGWVKSEAQRAWIERERLYNLRADGRDGSVGLGADELAAEIAVLYLPELPLVELWRVQGHPVIMTRTNMLEAGYPSPGGDFYYCLRLEPLAADAWTGRVPLERIRAICEQAKPGAREGTPVATTWLELVRG